MADRLAGLVLAGGRSRRFGSEKALARLGGKTLLEVALGALDAVAIETAVAAPPASEAGRLATSLGRALVGDAPGHPSGPLAGIAAGLAWAGSRGFDWLATLPCDTPLASDRILGELFAARRPLGAYAIGPDGAHAVIALWPLAALTTVAARLEAGEHPSLEAALLEAGARPRRFADARPFRNINTRADLADMVELRESDAPARPGFRRGGRGSGDSGR